MARPSPVDSICPACSQRVLPGDLVVFGHGELTHLNCHLATTGGEDAVARYLQSTPGRAYCHTCLAASLDVSWQHASKAVSRLRASPGFRVHAGTCAVCGKERVTVQAVG
jgi:hypothetical protein